MLDVALVRIRADHPWLWASILDSRCAVCQAEIVTAGAFARWQHAWRRAGVLHIKVTCGAQYCRARAARQDAET